MNVSFVRVQFFYAPVNRSSYIITKSGKITLSDYVKIVKEQENENVPQKEKKQSHQTNNSGNAFP